ncbi:MAG: hypothetical protein Q9M40_00190 [Sulfurimonas sp.]|nr:hypothetical protein [Sulfurimonas sp.]
MRKLSKEEYQKAREAIMIHVRKVVPFALMVAVASGLYLFGKFLVKSVDDGMSYFQTLL